MMRQRASKFPCRVLGCSSSLMQEVREAIVAIVAIVTIDLIEFIGGGG
jgi:hypothetical protein